MSAEPRQPIPMPVSEPGEWLEAPDLVCVDDLPEGAERDRIEKLLSKRTARFNSPESSVGDTSPD